MPTTIITIVGRSILVIGFFTLLFSAFYARGIESGITFALQGINLKIDSRAFYNDLPFPSSTWKLKNLIPSADHFFNFKDIKPGDFGKTIISMHVKPSPAWLCLNFDNLESNDNSQNEPESEEDSNGIESGELVDGLEFFAWIDDKDNKFEVGEKPLFGTTTQSASSVLNDKTYPVCDSRTGSPCGTIQGTYIGIGWCAGNLSVNLDTALISCDGVVLGNTVQTDSMSVDVSIRAVPSAENPKFICKNI